MVSESQDRRLRLGERLALRMHVAICRACRRFEAQLKFLRRAARHTADASGGPRLTAGARQRIARALRRRR